MARKPGLRSRTKGNIAVDEAVYGAIRRAMHAGRLAPGTKLQEPALARVLRAIGDADARLEEDRLRLLRQQLAQLALPRLTEDTSESLAALWLGFGE